MRIVVSFVLLFLHSCSNVNSSLSDVIFVDDDAVRNCTYQSPEVISPQAPQKVEIVMSEKYSVDSSCLELPEPQNSVLELDEGCYSGCLEINGSLNVTGKGSGKTIIICEDSTVEAAIYGKDVNLQISALSISSKTKGIDLDGKSSLKLIDSAVYDCEKGGVSGCIEGDSCSSEFVIENSLISDIKENSENSISYGVTIGPGKLEIKNSVLKNFHSFAVAVWGESKLVIENTVVENVHGKTGDFHGVGIYAFDSSLNMKRVMVKDVGTSFIYADVQSENRKVLNLQDVEMIGSLESEGEQGGLVFNGNIEAQISRVSISHSSGNGIFGSNINLNAIDTKIDGVTSDITTSNGFGIVLFDTEAQLERVEITESEKAGVLVDGASDVKIQDIKVSQINADPVNGEFGIGVAAQDGAVLSVENGVIMQTRECGIMAVDAEVFLNNVEVSDIQARECFDNGACTFADGVPFGHGVSLFSKSSLSFHDIFITGNANGFNIESSKVTRLGGTAFLIDNKSAVNAWNIEDTASLENAFDNVMFCNNKSIFTTDVQPVRESF